MASWKGKENSRGSYSKLTNNDSNMEQENDRMVTNLSSKISALKNIAIDIDKEAKYQNNFAGDMSNDFDSASGFLGSSMNRLNTLVSSGSKNRKMMCYMITFLVALFFFCYYVIARLRR